MAGHTHSRFDPSGLPDSELYERSPSAAVKAEVARRSRIRNRRWRDFQEQRATQPTPTSIERYAYGRVLTRRDRAGAFLFAIDRARSIASLRLDDWHRVRVIWVDRNTDKVLWSFGVTVCHALQVAVSAGMPYIDIPPGFRPTHLTRREIGEWLHMEQRNER